MKLLLATVCTILVGSGAYAQSNAEAESGSLSSAGALSQSGVSITNNTGGTNRVVYDGAYELKNVPGLAGIDHLEPFPRRLQPHSLGLEGRQLDFAPFVGLW